MKIVLSGVQGTGKSTLLQGIEASTQSSVDLFKQSGGILITEVVRSLVRSHEVAVNRKADHDSQMKILEAHYKNAITHPLFITDRGAIDAFAYATYNYITGQFSWAQHQEHKAIFEASLPYYTQHFYLPIEFGVVDDGFRDTDEKYRHQMDDIYRALFKRYKIDIWELRGTKEERLEEFLRFLEWDVRENL